jgi:hypothetical protein
MTEGKGQRKEAYYRGRGNYKKRQSKYLSPSVGYRYEVRVK